MRTREQQVAAYNGIRPSRIAEALDCSVEHVHGLIRSGALPAIDISVGSRPEYRVSATAFETYLKDHAVRPDVAA